MFVRQRSRPIAIGRVNPCGDWGNIRCVATFTAKSRDDEKNGQNADDFFDFHGVSFLFSTLQTYETIFEKQIIFIEIR